MSVKSKSQLKRLAIQQGRKDEGMMLTREQIEEVDAIVADAIANPMKIRHLALAALELRERAAKVCEGRAKDFRATQLKGLRYEAKDVEYQCNYLAQLIRALPLPPDGADQQNADEGQPRRVAESQAPAPSEPGDGGVATTLGAAGTAHQLPAELLDDLIEYFDGRADVVDGSYGDPRPNEAMNFLRRLKELPSEQVPSQKGTDEPGGTGKPARAGEPRCTHSDCRNLNGDCEGACGMAQHCVAVDGFCQFCQRKVAGGVCWDGRTQA